MLRDGHHRTKRRKGTRNCFFCRKDVLEWQELCWPQVKALYDYCKLKPPTALCCNECYKRPHERLYDEFLATVMMIEVDNYVKHRPTIIKDKAMYETFISQLKAMNAWDIAEKFINEHT